MLKVITSLVYFTQFLLAETKPNIMIILTDDQGINDLSCYGSDIPTPNIDSIATAGLKLENFYVAAPICTPSRFGLLTGRHPCRSEDQLLGALMFLDEGHKNKGIKHHETTLPTILQQNNYKTALLGKWHLGHGEKNSLPNQHGFDLFKGHTAGCVDFYTMRYGNTLDWYHNNDKVDVVGYATDIITDDAIKYLKQQKNETQPFFMLLSYNAPHFGKGWDDKNNQTINTMQPHPAYLERAIAFKDPTRRKYASKVIHLDDAIGKLLDTLENENLKDDTLLIFLSDHGGDYNYGGDNQPYRGQKATLFEGGLRVPGLIQWPRKIKKEQVNTSVLSSLDLFPTICKFLKIETKSFTLDGIDMSDVMTHNKTLKERDLYWKIGKHPKLDRGEWISYRQGHYKYISDYQNKEYLFNLKKDPSEKVNLIQSHLEIKNEILRKIEQQTLLNSKP